MDLVVVLGVGEEFVRHGLEASEELLLRPATAFAARRCSLLLLLCATATHVPPRAVGRRCGPRRRLLLLSCTTAACVSQQATGRRLMIKAPFSSQNFSNVTRHIEFFDTCMKY